MVATYQPNTKEESLKAVSISLHRQSDHSWRDWGGSEQRFAFTYSLFRWFKSPILQLENHICPQANRLDLQLLREEVCPKENKKKAEGTASGILN